MGGGTHGSIKNYQYNVPKYTLENAVNKIIANNPNIRRDSVKNEFNDDTGYITMGIVYKGLPYTYTCRFYGGKQYWDTSKKSAVFIAYAYNNMHEGGSEGGRIKQHGSKFIHNLIQPFEQEFILKVDSILGVKHSED